MELTNTLRVDVFPDAAALTRCAAEAVVRAAARACRLRGRFIWCVCGGQTPRALYELLATDAFAKRIDWTRTELCFGDERCVTPDDPSSNYRMVWQALVRHVALAPSQVHRIEAERTPLVAADAYETQLKQLLGVSASGFPSRYFDLVLLGLGDDGHTASLFPGSLDEPGRWVSARPGQPFWRITLTPAVLNASQATLFLVSGAQKAAQLARVLCGPADLVGVPAQRIAPAGTLTWLADRAAAARLDPDALERSAIRLTETAR